MAILRRPQSHGGWLLAWKLGGRARERARWQEALEVHVRDES